MGTASTQGKFMRNISKPPCSIRLCAGLALWAPIASMASLQTITDVWGGNGNGSIAAGCTTYAPIPALGNFFGGGGFRALGGNVACGYVGATTDQTAASGSLRSHDSLAPIGLDTPGSSYRGDADARAAYGALGVSVRGTQVGGSSGTNAVFSTSAALFDDMLTPTSPLIASQTPGFVRYVFQLDGNLSTLGGPSGTASVQLNIQHDGGPVFGIGRLSAQAGDVGTFSAIDSDIRRWTLGASSVSGAGLFGSTLHVPFFGDVDRPIKWGVPWQLQVGLLARSAHTADVNFMSTLQLVDIQLFDAAHQRVTDFSLSSASGTDYLIPTATTTVPEPETWLLTTLGLAVLVARRKFCGSERGSS